MYFSKPLKPSEFQLKINFTANVDMNLYYMYLNYCVAISVIMLRWLCTLSWQVVPYDVSLSAIRFTILAFLGKLYAVLWSEGY